MIRTCRECGCTDTTPCISPSGQQACAWAEPDLCDFCEQEEVPLVEVYSEAEASYYLRAAAGGSR